MVSEYATARQRFHRLAGPFTVAELASTLGLEAQGDTHLSLTGTAPLHEADAAQLSFFDNAKYRPQLRATKAGCVVLRPADAAALPAGCTALLSLRPYADFARILQLFYPEPAVSPGQSPQAYVAPDAQVAEDAVLEPYATIMGGAEVGAGAYIAAGAYIGPGVVIGAATRVGPGAKLQYCVVGQRCRIHAGAAIGQDGFGFAFDGQKILKVPQVGIVHIGDDVEIGANTTIDRGAVLDTVIGDACKIDNQVQIAHNVVIGPMCQLAAQTGIAGSTRLGRGVVAGGKVAISGHLEIADGVMIAGRSGVTKSITRKGEVVGGFPAQPIQQWRRGEAALARLIKRQLQNRSQPQKELDDVADES